MPIKTDMEGDPSYRLISGKGEITVTIGRGKGDVAYLKTDDFDFMELAKKHSEDDTATKIGLKNALEEMDIALEGDARMIGVFSEEASVLLGTGARIVAGPRWGGEKQLYPVE